MKLHFLPCFLFMISLKCLSQSFVPGNTYYGNNYYIEYLSGNFPLIISLPHGGYLSPSSLPDRNCSGCVYVNDAYTQELGREISDAIHRITGCYPHLIINRLSRRKLDANRDIQEAADGNMMAEQAWYDFHEFIDSAKQASARQFTKGLYIDLHGHAHQLQRIELGYLLTDSELRGSDESLNSPSYVSYSSIRDLAENNISGLTHAELIRGPQSLGSLLESKSFAAVPSSSNPYPLSDEPYYSGGYNTGRHSRFSGGHLDGIQIEVNQNLRLLDNSRKALADSLAEILIDFLDFHYLEGFRSFRCEPSVIPQAREKTLISPNPACRNLFIESTKGTSDIVIYNLIGQPLVAARVTHGNHLDIGILRNGVYIVTIKEHGGLTRREKLIVHCH